MSRIKFNQQVRLHEGAIYSLAQGNRPHLFYSGSFDQKVVLWDTENWGVAQLIAQLPAKALALYFHEGRNYLFVGTFIGGVHVIDVQAKKELHLLQKHQKMIFDIQVQDGHLWVLGGDGALSVWELDTWTLKAHIDFKEGKLRKIVFGADDIFIGTQSGKILILDRATLKYRDELTGHEALFSVNCLLYLKENHRLISGSRDGHLILWDLEKRQMLKKVPAHYMAIYDIQEDPNQNLFASASMDKSIKIWDKELNFVEKIERKGLQGHTNSINKLMWNSEGLFSTGDDKQIIWWKAQ